ncbi:MAG TPA: SGNH/GDSL hydrolase family protein [Acidimicrobiia bacterium]
MTIAVIAILGAVAAGAYALNANDTPAHAAGSGVPTTAQFGAGDAIVPAGAVKALPERKLDHTNPLRLWIGGDSLAGSFGPALGDRVGATGIVKTVIDYKVSSGLWSNDIRDWYQRAAEQMVSDNPEAVVFIIGTNDTPVVNQVDANGDGVPDWQAAYRIKVARMMDLFVGAHHRTVYWLGPPTLGTQSLDRGADAIGQIMHEEALKRSPDVTYIDTYKLFSTKDGTYSRRILDENGNEIVARIADGTHFSELGAQYLARAVFAFVDARWRLTKQAEPAVPIGWTSAPGSGESVPGFSSQPRSRYRSTYRPTATTAPSFSGTTAPPEASTTPTAAPTTVASTVPHTTPQTTAPKSTSPPTTTHTTPSVP